MHDDFRAQLGTTAEPASHGSLERLPGNLFRAMATLFLRKQPSWSRGALARELTRRLEESGIHYHERTLKRQLAGTISTVPPELEMALQQLLSARAGYGSDTALREALVRADLWVPPEEHTPAYLAVERILPLAQLLLHLNPDKSKRALACRLHADLEDAGLSLNIDSLQSTLAGKKRLVRVAVRDRLLDYLREHGIESEADARARWQALQQDVQHSIAGREFVDARRFRRLCLVWRMHRKAASSRALAVKLQERLRARGMAVGLHHLQNLVNERTRLVRRGIVEVLEQLVREDAPDVTDLDAAAAEAAADVRRAADLCWVKADPIVDMARAWLAANPGASLRQLARLLATTIRRMGYSTSANTLQPIVGGWKRKTRGFVYRAMRKQLDGKGRAPIPAEHLLSPLPAAGEEEPVPTSQDPHEEALARLAIALRKHRATRKPTVDSFLRAARRYFPGARSMNFLEFQAYRAARLFGLTREEAREAIAGVIRRRGAESVEDESGFPASLEEFGVESWD